MPASSPATGASESPIDPAETPIVKVNLEIARSLTVAAPYARVQPLLEDLEGTIQRFPKLRRLKKLGPNRYLWEMETIGSRLAKIAHEVSYGAAYTLDPSQGLLSWQPIPGQGNARIEGQFRLRGQGERTEISFAVQGELYDVPVPLMYRLVAPPFIQGKFTSLVDRFLEATRARILQG
jgi:carbon monoxide dehydrogenase subunit G